MARILELTVEVDPRAKQDMESFLAMYVHRSAWLLSVKVIAQSEAKCNFRVHYKVHERENPVGTEV